MGVIDQTLELLGLLWAPFGRLFESLGLSIDAWLVEQLIHAPWLVAFAGILFIFRSQRRYRALQYLYFTRVPLLALTLVAAGPWVLLWSNVSGERSFARLDNLFTLTGLQLYVVTVLTAFAVWPATMALRLILAGGGDWFGVALDRSPAASELPGAEGQRVEPVRTGALRIWGWVVRNQQLASLVFALPLVGLCFWMSSGYGWRARWGAVSGPGAGLPPDALGFGWAALSVALGLATAWLVNRWLGRSLLDEWVPEIAQAFVYAVGSFFFWILGYLLLRPDLSPAGLFHAMPAAGYLLIVVINLTWILTGLAYFLDRFRISLVVTLVLLSVGLNALFDRDSVYPTAALDTPLPTFAQSLDAWRQSRGEDAVGAVVVAASGGGVMSSYWTARVLSVLQHENEDFDRHVVLASGTSGGAMGVTSFVSGYTGPVSGAAGADSTRMLDVASAPALAHTTWGMAFPDLLRAVTGGALPMDGRIDRGWSLEQAWRGADPLVGGATLGSWGVGTRAGWRPAIALNTTIAETGGKLAFATVDFDGVDPASLTPTACPSGPSGFAEMYAGRDVDVVTAVRLSASFPWVLPMAHAEGALRRCHLGDGGYNDNSALWSVIELLESAGPESFGADGTVLVVEIRIDGPEPKEPASGTPWSLTAPLGALVSSVYSNAVHRDALEICLLRDAWAAEGVRVDHVVFQLNDPGPFFWGLTETDRSVVDHALTGSLDGWLARNEVRRWMRGQELAPPAHCD